MFQCCRTLVWSETSGKDCGSSHDLRYRLYASSFRSPDDDGLFALLDAGLVASAVVARFGFFATVDHTSLRGALDTGDSTTGSATPRGALDTDDLTGGSATLGGAIDTDDSAGGSATLRGALDTDDSTGGSATLRGALDKDDSTGGSATVRGALNTDDSTGGSATLRGITESWANNDITDAELGREGYVMFRKDRIGRRGGGVYQPIM